MWDSHFRVGGGIGTDLDAKTCPKFSFKEECIAASLMLHVTKQASGYFENVWTWVADQYVPPLPSPLPALMPSRSCGIYLTAGGSDNDLNTHDEPDDSINQISLYVARGMLIESQGPSWFYGTGSEHCVYYQYQVHEAKSVRLFFEEPWKSPTKRLITDLSGPHPDRDAILPAKTSCPQAVWGTGKELRRRSVLQRLRHRRLQVRLGSTSN